MRIYTTLLFSLFAFVLSGQQQMQFFRYNDQRGQNVFESSKADTVPFENLKVRVGGDFAFQFQGLNQMNDANSLVELGTNFNLPSANLNIDVQLYDGLRMHLRTYLSSLHHPEAWVKGGHLQIDKLEFVKSGFLDNVMKYTTIRIGLDEFNYGDPHFRRSDNARVIFNPFVGNYIMDAFSTEAFGEVTVQYDGFLAVIGLTNGKLNQSTVVDSTSDNKASFFGKIGYDKQLSEDFRLRLTGSWYINKGTTTGTWIYGGDRGGSRYYNIMADLTEGGSDFEGRLNPRFRQLTSLQFNPFIKFKGLEFFGILEVAMNSDDQGGGQYTQLAGELLYRFGKEEKFYVGARYNNVTGEDAEDRDTKTISRFNAGAGWFLTKNVLIKAEYVTQSYKGRGWGESKYQGGEFNGLVLEGAISF